MNIFEQLEVAKQLRQAGNELECSALKEGGVEIRDFLLNELAEKIQEPLPIAPVGECSPLFPVVTLWEAVDVAELKNLKEAVNRTHGANRSLELPKINGLRIEIKVSYGGHQLFWRLNFKTLDDLRQASHAYNVNLDWERARQELRTKFSSARENLERLELLWGSVGKPVPHDLVDWKEAAKGLCKVPEHVNFGLEWALGMDRWQDGVRTGLVGGEWIYVGSHPKPGWDLSDACSGNVCSPEENPDEDMRLCQEQAIPYLDVMGYTALYRYQKDGVGELVHVNICSEET